MRLVYFNYFNCEFSIIIELVSVIFEVFKEEAKKKDYLFFLILSKIEGSIYVVISVCLFSLAVAPLKDRIDHL